MPPNALIGCCPYVALTADAGELREKWIIFEFPFHEFSLSFCISEVRKFGRSNHLMKA